LSDDTNLDLLEAELLARDAGDVMLDGQAFVAMRGTAAALTTAGNARNSQFTSLVGYPFSPDFPWIVAAAVAAQDAKESDPARPRQKLPLLGVLGPQSNYEFTRAERNTLLSDGVSTLLADAVGQIRIDRLITTYQSNASAVPDTAYRNITTRHILSYIRWAWNAIVSTKYPRHKLANNNTLFAPNQTIMTPSLMISEALSFFRNLETIGLVEDFAQFKADIICERDLTDSNRLNMSMTFNLVNELVVFATKVQFIA
jgi:phage tail sheath gpL-like